MKSFCVSVDGGEVSRSHMMEAFMRRVLLVKVCQVEMEVLNINNKVMESQNRESGNWYS